MLRAAVAAAGLSATAVLTAVAGQPAFPLAAADPPTSAQCPEGARTSVPAGHLQCRAGQWRPNTNMLPSTRWLTYGPAVTLTGEARANADIASGDWIAEPQEPRSRCRAEQMLAADPVDPPQVSTSGPGQVLSLRVEPRLYAITLSGDCLWHQVAAG